MDLQFLGMISKENTPSSNQNIAEFPKKKSDIGPLQRRMFCQFFAHRPGYDTCICFDETLLEHFFLFVVDKCMRYATQPKVFTD